jgi:hypothetical protein
MALTGGFPRLAPAGAGDKGAQARTKRTPVRSLLSSRLRRCYGLTGEFADLHPNERPARRLVSQATHCRTIPSPPKCVSSQQLSDVWSDRSPYRVVPESPPVGSLVPHQVRPGRPRRWSRRRWRPRRRKAPGSGARGSRRASRALPVVAVIPVPVRDGGPARVPLITRAPVIAGRRGRRRRGPGVGAASQFESGQRQPATHQRARRPPDPPSRLPHSPHLPRISLRRNPGK